MGELVSVDSGYASGVWLRSIRTPGKNQAGSWIETWDLAIILEIIDDDVRILTSAGNVGWIRRARLARVVQS